MQFQVQIEVMFICSKLWPFTFSKSYQMISNMNPCQSYLQTMSTDAPMPPASELPSCSTQSSSAMHHDAEAISNAHWDKYNQSTSTSNLLNSSETTTPDENVKLATKTSSTSSTAYSFTGSALVSESTASINKDVPKSGENVNESKSSTNQSSSNGANNNEEEKMDESMYECNICVSGKWEE